MVKCPKCGAENPDIAKGCGECGYTFTEEDKNPQKVNPKDDKKPQKPKSSNNTIIIAVVAIVVIIAIVGIFASGMFSGDSSQTSTVSEDSEDVSPIIENDSSDNASAENTDSEYWASAKTDKFHLPTCEWAEKISEDNKVVYHSRDDAISDGKEPCSVCNP